MPMGKSRISKRSSSSSNSYASTATTLVFLALCVLGVWMLSSNSVTPPETTTRNTITRNEPQTTTTPTPTKSNLPAFEDNPGDLPDDAIKSDDEANDNGGKSQQDQKVAILPEISKDSIVDNGGDAIITDKQESSAEDSHGKESTEEQEKQKESENQNTEESSFTQNQRIEETTSEESKQTSNNNEESEQNRVSEENNVENQTPNENIQIPDELDQEKRLQQQLKEDESRENTQESQYNEDQQQQQPKDVEMSNEEKPDQTQPQKEYQDESQQTQAGNQETQQKEDNKEEGNTESNKGTESNTVETFPAVENTVIPKESKESKKSWATQATQSANEKERRKDESSGNEGMYETTWQLCNVTAGPDYIPCLDNEKAVKKLRSTKHFEHRERHCPEQGPTCLVPVPEGYKKPTEWPKSRDKIWYHNVPHTKLAEVKGHQNWVKVTGEFLTFPGGGTQFIHGALHYIDFLQQSVPAIAWGKQTRVILDVGCGVASFGGYLFDRNVIAMSFAPKDEHEAQVQFALERGIPAISAVMGSQRLQFPSRVFDVVHCARCRVPWHADDGLHLLELNRVLRPGGYFVWSATPVYQKLPEDVEIWKAMSSLTASMCWELVTIKKDKLNSVGAAIYRKPTTNDCYNQRKHKRPPMCKEDDDPNAAWYVPLQACMHPVPVDNAERGTKWPEPWPRRVQTPPYWLNSSQMGIYGKPSPQDFATDHEHWKRVVSKSYLTSLGISWSNVRNVMDMRAVYGGFAAALKDLPVWVMNVVNIDSPDTLPIIYERGLFGIYHDWCESFSTYPRTYDLLHADHLFSRLKKRCKLAPVMAEVDRIVRPGGKLIVRDESSIFREVENLLKSLHWEVHVTISKNQEGLLSAQKGDWRPDTYVDSS
ncbi:hypothetical protein SO802_026025 [Lithocarpus litseifolius]|uniref:Methyltransferase PMT27 n=1 Tax=Lithocarpus litseifolius TaxID=425828 RepID=A0AAW2BYB9_9ROSI